MKISRRQFLQLGGGVAALSASTFVYGKYESRRLVTTFKNIGGLGLKNKIRVLHLSDFHASSCVPWSMIQKSVEIGLSHAPDLVFLTGDYISGTVYDFGDYPKYFELPKTHPNCFACLGNHDLPYHDRRRNPSMAQMLEAKLNEVGVRLLFNQSVDLEMRGSAIRLAGLGDLWNQEVRPDLCLKPASIHDIPTLLLAHNPDTKTAVEQYQWDVMFSGHTHGGQLVVPLVGWRPILPVHDKSMVEGIYAWKGRHIHITRGVGCLHGLRFNCPPEVSLIDLS